MRHNRRPPVAASTLPLYAVAFDGEGKAFVACPSGCGHWSYLRHGMVPVHRPDGARRCKGSAQRVWVDITWMDHRARLARAPRPVEDRRSGPVHLVGSPPAPVALCRMRPAA